VKLAVEPVAGILPHVQAGKLRVLAVTDSRRSPVFPELPTIAETGVPGYVRTSPLASRRWASRSWRARRKNYSSALL
jgi:tripartite-type tricarboxylate transporter receptor subunit TctC